ncbi:MAG TPA: hypothetical protein VN282_24405 [Pyrinomonadaceae bacterium]|nr:hypothetical protein [Pyrinomonadaceae bacterium]
MTHDPSQRDDPGPAGEFAARLMARRDGSGGVIDVRSVERRYDSLVDWVAGRVPLLGLLTARYGTVNTRAPGSREPLPIVPGRFARSGGEPTSESDSPVATEAHRGVHNAPPRDSSAGTPAAEIAASRANVPAPAADVGGTRGTPLLQRKAATPAQATPASAAPPGDEPAGRESQRGAEPETVPPAVKERPAPHEPSGLAAVMPLTKESPGPNAEVAGAAEDNVRQPSAPGGRPGSSPGAVLRVPEGVKLVQPKGEAGVRAPLLLRRRRSVEAERAEAERAEAARDGAARDGAPGEVPPQPLAAPEPTTRPGAKVDPAPPFPAASVETRPAVETPDLSLASAPSTVAGVEASGPESLTGTRLPPGLEQPAAGRLDRQQIQRMPLPLGATTTADVSAETRTGSAGAAPRAGGAGVSAGASRTASEQARARVSAPEVMRSPLHLSGARMVWRKSLGGAPPAGPGEPRPAQPVQSAPPIQTTGGPAALYRAEAAASSPPPAASDGAAAPPAPAQTGTGAGGVDLERITEHVSRVILRRVAVERERRGFGKWL